MSLRFPQFWCKDSCICRKCLAAKKLRAEIEEQLYILVQLGRTGVITAEELTGKKVMGAA